MNIKYLMTLHQVFIGKNVFLEIKLLIDYLKILKIINININLEINSQKI